MPQELCPTRHEKQSENQAALSSGPASLSLLLSLGIVPPALAQASRDATPATPSASATPTTAKPDQAPPAPTGFWERSTLLGDMGGLRPWLGNYGVTLACRKPANI